jgi:23S rRNA-/tRNA-specific pseudouridylate synthase
LVASLPDDEHILDATLETGRIHQIRIHAASLGMPIVGDHRYGESSSSPGREDDDDVRESYAPLCLHAWTLDFEHPLTGKPLHLESQLPEWAEPEQADG